MGAFQWISEAEKTDLVLSLGKGPPRSEEGYRSHLCNEDTEKSRYAGERAGL